MAATGHLWALVEEWMQHARYTPTQARLAELIEVSESSLSELKYARQWPTKDALVRLADEIGVTYEKALDAVLKDHGYRDSTISGWTVITKQGSRGTRTKVTRLPATGRKRAEMQRIPRKAARKDDE